MELHRFEYFRPEMLNWKCFLKPFEAFQVIKLCSFLKHSFAILSSLKIMIIFYNTSAEIKTKSEDMNN